MKISVITACLNSGRTIGAAIESLVRQRGVELEHIIVDGGSCDETLEIIKSSSLDTKVLVGSDGGIYAALNKGVSLATGELIFFLHSDDVLIGRNALLSLHNYFGQRQDIMVGGEVAWVDNEGLVGRRVSVSLGFKRAFLKFGFQPPHTAVMVPKVILDQLDGFDESFRSAGDFDFFVRTMLVRQIEFVSTPIRVVNMGRGGFSDRGWTSYWRTTLEIERSLRKNGFRANRLVLLARLPIKWLSRTWNSYRC